MRPWHYAMLVRATSQARCDRIQAIFANIAVLIGLAEPVLGKWAAPAFWYIDRARQRLIALITRLEAGTYRPRKPAKPRPARDRKPSQHLRLPGRRHWLLSLLPPERGVFGLHLANFINEPETQALLAQAPQAAARILRPLVRLLNLRLDGLPPLPPRKPRPKKPRPRKPTAQQQRDALWYPNVEGKPIDLYKAARDMDPTRRRRRAP